MPDGLESAMLELHVQDQLSVLLIASTSYTDPEFGQVCDRIRELSLRVEEDALLVPALWRLSMHHFMRCDVDAGRDVGRQLLDLPAAVGPGAAQVTGQIALALSSHVRGAQAYARRHFEEAVSLCDAGHDAGAGRVGRRLPATVARTFEAIVAWLLGDEDQAETEALSSFYREAAIDIGSWATMISVWGASTVSMLRRDAPTTLQRCDDGIALATAGGYGLGVPYMTVNRGWAIASLGDTEVGESEIVRGTALAEAFGAEYMRAYFRAARAEVCLLAGRCADALAAVEEGLTDRRVHRRPLLRSRAVPTARRGGRGARSTLRQGSTMSRRRSRSLPRKERSGSNVEREPASRNSRRAQGDESAHWLALTEHPAENLRTMN